MISKKLPAICIGALFLLTACSTPSTKNNTLIDVKKVAPVSEIGSVPDRILLEQGWTPEVREKFWYTSQGARIIPYTWFLWLEQANSETYFRSAEHMESLRYLPAKTSSLNPGGLPIGFALDYDQKTKTAWMGFTCSACHSNQLDYQGNAFLIDGGPTLANFVLFNDKLLASLNETQQNNAKFDRFAKKVLAEGYNQKSAGHLREELFEVALGLAERIDVNKLPASFPKDFTSYARVDAFGNIQNAGTAFALNDLTNKNVPDAPVSYPFLWGTHQSDVVQWNASAPNTPVVGPLARNIGEVVGVYGGLEIKKAPWIQRLFGKKTRYSSTVDMIGLGHLEAWVKALRSPAWPNEYFPAIDAAKAADGAILYQQHCANCHQVIKREDEGKNYIAVKTPLSEVGTDPGQAVNAAYHRANTLILEGVKDAIIVGKEFGETADAIEIPVNGVVGMILKEPLTALEAGFIPERASATLGEAQPKSSSEEDLEHLLDAFREGRVSLKQNHSEDKQQSNAALAPNLDKLVYKARPLNGIWATAPYLHNGSVPSLWELLVTPEERTKRFWVGSREFDPVRVGYKSDSGLTEFKVLNDSGEQQKGNANLGHNYGTDLTETEKRALVEYMKTL